MFSLNSNLHTRNRRPMMATIQTGPSPISWVHPQVSMLERVVGNPCMSCGGVSTK